MTKNLIEQYNDLLEEQDEIEKRASQCEESIRRITEEGTTKDTVTGGIGGKQHFVIEGYPTSWIDDQRRLLQLRRNQLEEIQTRIMKKVIEVEKYIASIDDSFMRRIITKRVIDRKTWVQIAMEIGGGNTPDGIRMAYNRFFE